MSSRDAEIKERAEARVGALLRDKWHVDALIGLGGMAAVYEATHRNGKRAAIKILHAEAAMVPDIRARFLREGYLANRVGHPGAVSILDDDVDVDGTVYLVMELLEGRTLDAFRGASAIAPEELMLVAYGVLDVLRAAHQKNIVHRDLKPANVFLCTSSAVKVLDFGIARLQSVAQAQAPNGQTGRDVTLGTPGYMPPEQARGHWEKVDAQSDLWSLGATLFAVASGRLVHEAPTVNEQLLAAMTQPAAPLASVAPAVPREIAALVDRALAFEKENRWADASVMQAEVARIYGLLTGHSIGSAPPVSVASKPRSVVPDAPTVAASEHAVTRTTARSVLRRRDLVAAVAAGLVLLLFALLILRGNRPPERETPRTVAPANAAPTAEIAAPADDRSAAPAESSARASAPAPSPSTLGADAPAVGPKPTGRSLATGASSPTHAQSVSNTANPKSAARPPAPASVPSVRAEPDIFGRRK